MHFLILLKPSITNANILLYSSYKWEWSICKEFSSAKVLYNSTAFNTAAIDFMSTVKLNKSLTNNFAKLKML